MNYSYTELEALLQGNEEFSSITETDISTECRRDKYKNHEERVLRTLSWLRAAENAKDAKDINAQLTNTLIAFNALYAHPIQPSPPLAPDKGTTLLTPTKMMKSFSRNLVERDKKEILLEFLTKERDDLNAIMRNRYLCSDYWGKYMGVHLSPEESDWKPNFDNDNETVRKFFAHKPKPNKEQMKHALYIILDRTNMLRNQMLHGAAGYDDYYSRWQVPLCAKFMLPIVRRMLYIVIMNPTKWGRVPYPPQAKPNARTSRAKPLKGD